MGEAASVGGLFSTPTTPCSSAPSRALSSIWVSTAAFFESVQSDQLPKIVSGFVLVVRLSFGLLISVSLVLTAYFGATAWRLTSDPQYESSGSGPPFRLIRPQ